MGRRPILRKMIINILLSADHLRFKEIRERLEKIRGKKTHHENIAHNLNKLIEERLVEKVPFEGKWVYRLTKNYYEEQAKATAISILQSKDQKKFHIKLEESDPPFIAFIDPFKPFEEKYTKTTYFLPHGMDWSDVSYVIAARMLEAFTELKPNVQKGIIKLLAYAYWYGTRSLIENAYPKDVIKEQMDYVSEIIKRAKAEGDQERVEAEEAILSLWKIVGELTSKDNLRDFLNFLGNNVFDVKKLQSKVLRKMGHFMAAGELVFDSFLEFHSCVMSGFWCAGFIQKKQNFLMSFSTIWDRFIDTIFSDFASPEELENIKGDMNETLNKIRIYKEYLEPLKILPFKSKICIIYLWGFDEIFEVSSKAFLPYFEQWYKALEKGHLGHHTLLLTEGIKRLEKAYRRVKKHKPPADEKIDFVHWTLKDLYEHHPKGKELEFWDDLILKIRKQLDFKKD